MLARFYYLFDTPLSQLKSGTSVEDLLPSYWLVDMTVENFIDW